MLFARKGLFHVEQYINRLVSCGWNADRAWYVVEDLICELGLTALDEFVRREETKCG